MRDAELDEGNDVCASNRCQKRIALKIFKKKSKEAIVIDFVLLYTVTFLGYASKCIFQIAFISGILSALIAYFYVQSVSESNTILVLLILNKDNYGLSKTLRMKSMFP